MDKFKYYKGLGLTDAQSKVLSSFTYDDSLLATAILAYYESKDYHNKISFCESLVNFANKEELNRNLLYKYIETYGKKTLNKSVDLDDFGGGFGGGFGASFGGGASFASVPAKGVMKRSLSFSNASLNSLKNDKEDLADEEFTADIDAFDDDYCEAEYSLSSNNIEAECNSVEDFVSCDSVEDCINSFEEEPEYNTGFIHRIISNLRENTRTDKYEHIEEKDFRNVLNSPTSTFRTTCNNASFDIIRKNLGVSLRIDKSMVRIEELLNYFNYYLENKTDDKFTITAEISNKPLSKNKLLYVGIKGRDIIPEKQNVVLLLDVSGSMSGNQEETQAAMITIASKLNNGDKLSLITYSTNDETVIDDITINEASMDYIIEKILKIEITGCTYGSRGLNSAYDFIEKNKIVDGVNRVVIITDGDFNFGTYSKDGIEKLVLDKKKTGAYLSVIGVGYQNTNDELMNTLAKNGNGNYCYIGGIEDVEENINNKYNQLMFSIAKDVKAQIEFNPKYVSKYRLIGYENREISHEDFKNDKVIAEPFGCGAHAVAIYELEMTEDKKEEVKSDLKYQKPVVIESNNLCTVSIRYKELDEDTSKEISKDIEYNVTDMEYNIKLAYIVYIIGEKLRNSEYITNKDVKLAEALLEELKENKELNVNKLIMLEAMLK